MRLGHNQSGRDHYEPTPDDSSWVFCCKTGVCTSSEACTGEGDARSETVCDIGEAIKSFFEALGIMLLVIVAVLVLAISICIYCCCCKGGSKVQNP